MQIDDETLMAFADGELPAVDAARLEAVMAGDPNLAARVQKFRAVRRALQTAYDSVAREPIPEHLRALLGDMASHEPEAPARVVDLSAARAKRILPLSPPAWAAIAATLIVGVLAGRMTAPDDLFVANGGHLRAGAALTRVLDQRLASADENLGADMRVGISFQAQDGQLCRTFVTAEGQSGVSGLACREEDGWNVRIAAAERVASGDYRQASAAAPAVLAMVDTLIAGEALDAEQERAARDRNWRP